MKEIVVMEFCDAQHETKVEAVYSGTITIDGERWEIELCEEHAGPLRELRSLLLLDGRKEIEKPKRQVRLPSPRINGRTSVPLPEKCPVCGKAVHDTKHGRGSFFTHFREVHKKTFNQYLAETEAA